MWVRGFLVCAKGSRNLCALLVGESVQKPLCLLCRTYAGLPVKMGGDGKGSSFSGELAGRILSVLVGWLELWQV